LIEMKRANRQAGSEVAALESAVEANSRKHKGRVQELYWLNRSITIRMKYGENNNFRQSERIHSLWAKW
jgi:hypothetical protein